MYKLYKKSIKHVSKKPGPQYKSKVTRWKTKWGFMYLHTMAIAIDNCIKKLRPKLCTEDLDPTDKLNRIHQNCKQYLTWNKHVEGGCGEPKGET